MSNTNIADQIMLVINQIAEKMGVAAEKIYPILRKQAFVEGLTNAFWIVVIATVCLVMIVKLINYRKKTNDIEDQTLIGVAIVGVILIGFLLMPSIKDTMTAFINPDWYVFNELLMKLIK